VVGLTMLDSGQTNEVIKKHSKTPNDVFQTPQNYATLLDIKMVSEFFYV
jgi:hypothetical protein